MNLSCEKKFECDKVVEEKGMERVRIYTVVDTHINR